MDFPFNIVFTLL